jgi:hypothetical protein
MKKSLIHLPITPNSRFFVVSAILGFVLIPLINLEPCSKPCIFSGYSLTQSAYLCYDTSTLKNFVSRHVRFIESIFPFKSTLTQAQRPESSTVSTWLPPIIKLSTVTPALIPHLKVALTSNSAMKLQQSHTLQPLTLKLLPSTQPLPKTKHL